MRLDPHAASHSPYYIQQNIRYTYIVWRSRAGLQIRNPDSLINHCNAKGETIAHYVSFVIKRENKYLIELRHAIAELWGSL